MMTLILNFNRFLNSARLVCPIAVGRNVKHKQYDGHGGSFLYLHELCVGCIQLLLAFQSCLSQALVFELLEVIHEPVLGALLICFLHTFIPCDDTHQVSLWDLDILQDTEHCPHCGNEQVF